MATRETHVYDTITELNANQWNNLVEQSTLGTVFHRYEWLRAIEAGLDRRVRHAVVTKGSNPIGVFPNVLTEIDMPTPDGLVGATASLFPTEQLVSVHPGFGGPVVSSDPESTLDSLHTALESAGNGNAIAHKVRMGTLDQTRYSKYLTGRGYEPSVVSCRFVLSLAPGWERIKSGMHRTRRNGLNGETATVRRESLEAAGVEETHTDYVRNMDRIDATAYPLEFFEELSERLSERIEVFTAAVDGTVKGRYVCLVDEIQSAVRYYFSAVPDTSAYEHNVSEKLHAAAIKWAMDEGYDYYDFGTTGADFTDGLFQYKEKYGPDIHPILQWDRGLSPVAWNVFKLGRRLYRSRSY